MSSNFTADLLPPLPSYELKPLPPLVPWASDVGLALAAPIVTYWILSVFFHIIDVYDLWPQHRLHTPQELLMRNHVTRWDVLRDVIIQQIIETVCGLTVAYFEPEVMCGTEEYDVAVWARRIRMAEKAVPSILSVVGINAATLSKNWQLSAPVLASVVAGGKYPLQNALINGELTLAPAFASWETWTAKAIYYAVIPVLQLLGAMVVLDTWQYFWHRAMHVNKWLYSTFYLRLLSDEPANKCVIAAFHSRHHRLYVPYAYGALYNHPVEGFLLDTLGSGVAYLVMGLTTRQSILFFGISSAKTVDDHCGYKLPWDPFQRISSNNAAYHDIHHQSWGIKTNFSQPWFTFWDGWMGTMWQGDIKGKYERQAMAANGKWLAAQKGVSQPEQMSIGGGDESGMRASGR
jgi:sphinganine C4-monooxygenase